MYINLVPIVVPIFHFKYYGIFIARCRSAATKLFGCAPSESELTRIALKYFLADTDGHSWTLKSAKRNIRSYFLYLFSHFR